ncbi:MAG: glycerol-3-phosphate 1-O-acyltransferase PlsY [Paracoccaceae bacterium]
MPPIEHDFATLALVFVLAYLLGSVAFGMIVTKTLGLGDLRKIGSGNIGATNVLRTGNKKAALATLLLDGGKGAVAALVARAVVGEDAAQLAGLGAFVGHLFPVWLNFRGGKGVATFIGVVLALSWQIGLMVCATWLLVAVVTRYSSLAALIAAALSPLWVLFTGQGQVFFLLIIMTALIYYRHWPNIARLNSGTEPKIGAKT